jgi:serine/threonine-protein kinase
VAQFCDPTQLALDSNGGILVADSNNNIVRAISTSGSVTTFAGQHAPLGGYLDATGDAAQFRVPSGVVFDSKGDVYVADTANHAIRKISPQGDVTTFATKDNIWGPRGLAIDHADNLYVSDTGNDQIDRPQIDMISPSGVVTTLAGSGTPGYAATATL